MRVDREVGMVDGYENRRSLVEAACFGIEESIFLGDLEMFQEVL